jgi:hypothetical protein
MPQNTVQSVSAFKTDDGRIFEDQGDAERHAALLKWQALYGTEQDAEFARLAESAEEIGRIFTDYSTAGQLTSSRSYR